MFELHVLEFVSSLLLWWPPLCRYVINIFEDDAIFNILPFFKAPMRVIIVSDLFSDITLLSIILHWLQASVVRKYNKEILVVDE